MRLNRSRRLVLAASAVAIAFTLPLTLAGCGGSSGETSAAPGGAPKDFNTTHKDSMEYFKQQQAQKGAKK